jgi:GT2 family glycosyltransferase
MTETRTPVPVRPGGGAGPPRPQVSLSVLVVSWNTRDLLGDCLRSVLAAVEGMRAEVVVVDNASEDGSADMVRREFGAEPRLRLVANERNENFARGNNQAYALSCGEDILVLNPDVVLNRTALRGMIDHLRGDARVGIVSCNLRGTDGASQSLHRAFPTLPIAFSVWTGVGRAIDRLVLFGLNGRRYHLKTRRRSGTAVIDQAAAACLLIRRSTVERVGGLFDERFPLFFNDVDLSRRVWDAGLEVHVLYDLSVTHVGGASIRQLSRDGRDRERYESLARYYELHEPSWKARLLRLMVARGRRRAARAGA